MNRGALLLVPSVDTDTPARHADDYAKKFAVLADVSGLITESLDPDEAAQRIVESVRRVFRIERSALYRLDESSGDLTLWAISDARSRRDSRHWPSTFPSGHGVISLALRERRAVMTEDILTDVRVRLTPELRSKIEAAGYHAVLAVPLIAKGTVIGALSLTDRLGRVFDADDIRLAEMFGTHAAMTLENARLFGEADEARRRFHGLVQGLDAIVWESDAKTGEHTFVSQRAEDLLGYPVRSWLTEPDFWMSVIHPEDRERVVECRRASIDQSRDHNVEYRALGADGTEIWLRDRVRVVTDVAGRVRQLRGVIVDITERKQAEQALRHSEEQLRHAQKMDAIGRLAGGVAHDFNNLLTAMTVRSQLLLKRLPETDPLRGDIQLFEETAQRATALTRQLLAFSRKQVLQPRVLDLNTVVDDLGRMLRPLIGEHIEVTVRSEDRLGRVKADPGQLEQVIVNLAVNARDAMPGGGRLLISTANVTLDRSYGRRDLDVTPGPYVMLAVSDTGCGMDAETKSRIFEPFFTTKAVGKGTGLGLSTVYGIVKQSGGHIWVYSEPDHGTTFKIYLPRVDGPGDGVESTLSPADALHGSETILLVDDEEDVRSCIRDVLESHGYSVLEASDGSEALLVAGEHRGAIDLLLTDVVMPKIGGNALARAVSAARPGVRVLFMSGYTEDAIVHQGVLDGAHVLEKPFTIDALSRKVRLALDHDAIGTTAARA